MGFGEQNVTDKRYRKEEMWITSLYLFLVIVMLLKKVFLNKLLWEDIL